MFQIFSFLEPFPTVKINREARRYIIPFDQKQQGNLRSGIYPLNNKKPSESSDISSRRIEERREKGREDAPIPREDRRKVWERGRKGGGHSEFQRGSAHADNFSLVGAGRRWKKQDLFAGSVTGMPGEKLRQIRKLRRETDAKYRLLLRITSVHCVVKKKKKKIREYDNPLSLGI